MGGQWHRTSWRMYFFFYEKGRENHELGTGSFMHEEAYQQLIKGYSFLVIESQKLLV
jgi:hypothetical protein